MGLLLPHAVRQLLYIAFSWIEATFQLLVQFQGYLPVFLLPSLPLPTLIFSFAVTTFAVTFSLFSFISPY